MRKGIIFIILFVTTSLLSCKKNDDKAFMNAAVITGYDMRTCACCGGLMINFENNVNGYTATQLYIVSNPTYIGITQQSTFPIYLNVDWSKYQNTCAENPHITITRFSK